MALNRSVLEQEDLREVIKPLQALKKRTSSDDDDDVDEFWKKYI